MSLSPEDYAEIADEVYKIDPLMQDPPLKGGDTFIGGEGNQQFYVVDAATDPVTGFQGMAVVPVVDGQRDYSQVVVAYAGTNPDDRGDILADVSSVIGGKTGAGTQVSQAEDFFDRVEDRLNKDGHTEGVKSTAGHSLGGFIAMIVAAEKRTSSTSFNGPDVWSVLSPEARAWMQGEGAKGRRPLTNFVNQFDVIGNSRGHESGATVFVKDRWGKDPLGYHNLADAFRFDSSGEMVDVGGRQMTGKEFAALVNVLNPGAAWVLRSVQDIVGGYVDGAASAGGAALSGLVVGVQTVGATQLASSVEDLADLLLKIRDVNDALSPALARALAETKSNAAALSPWITERDIEACVRKHQLQVEKRIDEAAVSAVNIRVGAQLVLVGQISAGVRNVVENMVAQDLRWAQTFGGGE
jgi:hypothetical protein